MPAMQIDLSTLTKMQLRKLNALRNSVGDEIGERAFLDWLSSQPTAARAVPDENAALIVDTLWPLVQHVVDPAGRVSAQAGPGQDHRRTGAPLGPDARCLQRGARIRIEATGA